MTRRRKKPAAPRPLTALSPDPQASADPANWGVNAEALSLPSQVGVVHGRGARGEVTRARRTDVFERLLARGALSVRGVLAVRRLQDDMAAWHRSGLGLSARLEAPSQGGARPGVMAEACLAAGARVRAALGLAGPASAGLLGALCETGAVRGLELDWREVVLAQTGERLADAQTAVLRAATENLAGAYALLDRRPRTPRP